MPWLEDRRRRTSRVRSVLTACAIVFFAASCSRSNSDQEGGAAHDIARAQSGLGLDGGGVNREGLAALDVIRARRDFNVNGSGVKVCVLSDSVRYLDMAKEITPQDVDLLWDQNGIQEEDDKHKEKDTGEGTAMLEVIHSIAPGAELMFAASGDAKQMFDNIRGLADQGCHIIVDDSEFYRQSPFQDDTISKAVNEVTANGVLYITSAGNRGNTKAGTSAAWEGFFRPGAVIRDSGGKAAHTMHVFAPGRPDGAYNDVLGECGRKGGDVHVLLFWNDPILPSRTDSQPTGLSEYELWAVDANSVLKDEEGNYVTTARLEDEKGNPIATACLKNRDEMGKCAKDGSAGARPCRHICFPAPNRTDSNRTSIVITKVSGKSDQFLHLDIYVKGSSDKNGCRLEHGTGGVISGHHGAAGAFSVASKSALDRDSALDPHRVFLGGPSENVNASSAEGPRRIYFSHDGRPYNPPLCLQKPDVTAADGVTVDVWDKPFFGTSAAAPQVAGIAALMWSKDRSLTAEQIKAALRKSARQITGATNEWNPLSGFGVVNAVRALRAIEAVKATGGHEASLNVCVDDDQRSRRVEQRSQSSMARPRLAPLK